MPEIARPRALELTSRLLIGAYGVMLVWAAISSLVGRRGSAADAVFLALALASAIGMLRGWRWAAYTFMLVNAIMAAGLLLFCVAILAQFHSSLSGAQRGQIIVGFLPSILVAILQLGVWVQFIRLGQLRMRAEADSLGPNRPS